MITTENIKDLRLLTMGEFRSPLFIMGGFFYFKDDKNEFHTCQLNQFDVSEREKKLILRAMTEKWIQEKRLYIRKDKPMHSFA